MSILYIRYPSRASLDNAPPGTVPACQFAWVADSGAITREGRTALPSMGDMVAMARRVIVLLAASDVTLLRMAVPPLSGAKLKAALPNLIEDQLITDPAESVIVAGPEQEGMRTIAVAQRAWAKALVQGLAQLGARSVVLYPEQLCLPCQDGHACAAVSVHGEVIDLTLRLSQHTGLGVPVMPEMHAGTAGSAARDVLQTLRVLAPEGCVILFVPVADLDLYQQEADADMTVMPDQWQHWIRGAQGNAIDLMPAVGTGATGATQWRRWRWPLALAGLIVLVNIVGLNVEWLRMRREADALRASMLQTFRSAYPKETVIIDPLVQMRQKMAQARNEAGQSAPDDFTALAAGFGEAWSAVAGDPASLSGIEYRERSLLVKVKPPGEALLDKIKPALAARNLALSQPSSGVWQIKPGSAAR